MVLGTRQHPLSGQIAMARAAACKPIFVLGGGKIKREDDLVPADFMSAVRTLRPADTLCIPYLYALADPLKAKRGFLSEYFNECIEEIEAPNRCILSCHQACARTIPSSGAKCSRGQGAR